MELNRSAQNDTSIAQGRTADAEDARTPRDEARKARVRALSPLVDVFEGPDAILVHVDVPGVAREDVSLRLEKNELLLQATRRESIHGAVEYRRTFSLPQDVDGDAISADLQKGVLALTLPRKASAKPRTIEIRG